MVGPGSELQLTIDGRAVRHDEVLAELQVLARGRDTGRRGGGGARVRELYAVAEQLAARAATPATRRQYAAIYRSFGDWLREQPRAASDRRRPRRGRDRRLRPLPGDRGRPRRRAGGARHTPHLPVHGPGARQGARPPRRRRRREGPAPQGGAARDADRDRVGEPAARPRPARPARQARLRAAARPRGLRVALRRAAGPGRPRPRRPRANARHLRAPKRDRHERSSLLWPRVASIDDFGRARRSGLRSELFKFGAGDRD